MEKIIPLNALKKLMEGNLRYSQDKMEHPDRSQDRRMAVSASQSPFAIILGCADSRVSPEIIFDQGLGDLFVVRVAGNVLGPIELASIEFSALYLKSEIILVLGHENCGAVTAVLNDQIKDIESVADLIQPAITLRIRKSQNPVAEATKANVRMVVKQLKNTAPIQKLIDEKKIDVVGAYYNLVSGKVDLLDFPE